MTSVYDISLSGIDGTAKTLREHAGKVLLIVNVASKCGLTPQYEALQKLYAAKQAQGLEVLGFPANNFAGQEPGSNDEIASFCQLKYEVTFPLYSKISVAGADTHPLYKALITAQPKSVGTIGLREKLAGHGITPTAEPEVLWNFEKFLVSRNGEVIARFAPDVAPDDALITAAIDKALAA